MTSETARVQAIQELHAKYYDPENIKACEVCFLLEQNARLEAELKTTTAERDDFESCITELERKNARLEALISTLYDKIAHVRPTGWTRKRSDHEP